MNRNGDATHGDGELLDSSVAVAVHDALSGLVSATEMPVHLIDGARLRARRMAFHRRLSAIAVSVVLVAGAGVGVKVFAAESANQRVSVASLVPQWPQRGADATDSSGIERAMATWDALSHEQHTLREVLFASRDSVGSVVIVLATDDSGRLHLGGLTGDNPNAFSPSTVVLDRVVDSRPRAAFVLHNEVGHNPVLVAVTDPRYETMSWTQTAALPDRPPHDAMESGVDTVDFFDPVFVPKTVTFSGSGVPDLTVPVQ